MNFVDLEEEEVPLLKVNKKTLTDTNIGDNVLGDLDNYSSTTIVPIEYLIEEEEEESSDSLCLKNQYSIQNQYGCKDSNGYFLLDNLFSELTDEYQRTLARINLGIADEYSLTWGNIKGNLSKQSDLYEYINSTSDAIIDRLNTKLSQWAYDITQELSLKANITSPSLLGIPTTSLPLLTDNSDRIASTEWVNAKIKSASISTNMEAMQITPEFTYYGEDAVDVIVTWEYVEDVTTQTINGIQLNSNIRTYTFSNINSNLAITLEYTYNNKTESKTLLFTQQYPIYYGTSSNYTLLSKTISSTFVVTANENEYIYIFIPNSSGIEIAVNSIIGGFTLYGTQIINQNKYYIYKSAISGLGETNIELINSGGTINELNQLLANRQDLNELLDTKADLTSIYTKQQTLELIQIPIISCTSITQIIQPNKFYVWNEVAQLNITIEAGISGIINEYQFQFDSGDTPTVLTLPTTIKWLGNSTILANKTYQVSIINNCATLKGGK